MLESVVVDGVLGAGMPEVDLLHSEPVASFGVDHGVGVHLLIEALKSGVEAFNLGVFGAHRGFVRGDESSLLGEQGFPAVSRFG